MLCATRNKVLLVHFKGALIKNNINSRLLTQSSMEIGKDISKLKFIKIINSYLQEEDNNQAYERSIMTKQLYWFGNG